MRRVVVGHVGVEEHLVAEARAAARADGDAQREVGDALLLHERADLVGCGVGEDDHFAGASSGDPGNGVRLSVRRPTAATHVVVSGPGRRVGEGQVDLARRAVGERVEVVDPGAAERVDEALDQALVQRAHDLGVGLGQLAERAVGEGDRGACRRRRPPPPGRTPARRAGPPGPRRTCRRRASLMSSATASAAASASPCSRPASTTSSLPRPPAAATRSSMRASTGKVAGSSPSDGASAASE